MGRGQSVCRLPGWRIGIADPRSGHLMAGGLAQVYDDAHIRRRPPAHCRNELSLGPSRLDRSQLRDLNREKGGAWPDISEHQQYRPVGR